MLASPILKGDYLQIYFDLYYPSVGLRTQITILHLAVKQQFSPFSFPVGDILSFARSFAPLLDMSSRVSHAGLSKSLGLIEGFGGRGKGGLPASLSPAEESDAKYLREKYGYNAYLSDRISLDRTIPDHRPSK